MDPVTIAILLSLLAITTIVVIIGINIVNLLRDLRVTLNKTNSILDDTHSITSSVAGPVSSVSEFVMGFRNGLSVFNKFFSKEE